MKPNRVFSDEDGGFSVRVADAAQDEARTACLRRIVEEMGPGWTIADEGSAKVRLSLHEYGCSCGKRGCDLGEQEFWEFVMEEVRTPPALSLSYPKCTGCDKDVEPWDGAWFCEDCGVSWPTDAGDGTPGDWLPGYAPVVLPDAEMTQILAARSRS